MPEYLLASSVDEAVAALRAGSWTVLAGGTDIYPALVDRPQSGNLLDVSGIEGLRGIAEDETGWRIGALATWSDVAGAALPPLFDGLKAAAREVGGRQIQNAATLAGNLCNASPAADGVPPLLTLDATVELASSEGLQQVPLAAFVLGNRRTLRRPDQLLTAIRVPRPAAPARGGFVKLGARRYLVISIAMAAAVLEAVDGKVAAARVAVGACSEVACRLGALEADLVGRPLQGDLGHVVDDAHIAALTPIDDIRASAGYRRTAALVLLRRLLSDLGAAA